MDSDANDLLRYDPRTIALHWISAALVVSLWVLGQTIDFFPKGTLRVGARSVHISLGVALTLVLAARIWWRVGQGARLPPAGAGWLDKLASTTHYVLYLLLIVTVLLGMTNAWVRGDVVFGLFTIPAFDPGNDGLRDAVEKLHAWAADALAVVVLLHAGAGLVHHFVWKDDVLRRMLRQRARLPADGPGSALPRR